MQKPLQVVQTKLVQALRSQSFGVLEQFREIISNRGTAH
jgi:hypothetical protein